MRIMTLTELLAELRDEARLSGDVAHGSHLNARHKALLRRTQEDLHAAHDWPALRLVRTATVPAGQRFTAYPTHIRFQNIIGAFASDTSGRWIELAHGIGVDELNLHDSDADVRRPQPVRWAHYLDPGDEVISGNMFELWPIPDREVKIRFEAKRQLLPLVDDADVTTLDGPLIAMFAAAEMLAAQKAEDAPFKLQKAQQRFDLLRSRQTRPTGQRTSMARPVGAVSGQRFRTPE